MQNKVLRKGLVVGIIVLFIGLSIASSNANVLNVNNSKDKELCLIPLTSGNTIYVDDDNTEGPWDGTLEYPYQYIQDGVDNAGEGDTIYVFNGTYYENVEININFISLIGEDKATTVIDGNENGDIVRITDDYVYISRFTIQNGDIGVNSYSNYNKYDGNIIMNNDIGIWLNNNQNNLKESCGNKIINNIIKHNNYGIWGVVREGCFNIKFKFNKIYSNVIYDNYVFGIYLDCFYNTISKNHISYNGHHGYGYQFEGGICLMFFNNKIINNNLSNNKCGITIIGGLINLINKNNFFNNDLNAYFISIGIMGIYNQWVKNYWDDWGEFGPYIIYGDMILDVTNPYEEPEICRNIDWFPAKKPYEIPDTSMFEGCGIE